MRALLLMALAAVVALPANGQEEGIPAGTAMPGSDIQLVGQSGSTTLAAERGRAATLVVFWSNRCPWGTKIESRLTRYVQRYRQQGVATVLVNSNDAEAFDKENAAENAVTAGRVGAPVLGDADGALAEAFGATRNPAFFLFDGNHTLVYSGSFDDSPSDEAAVKSNYVDDATRLVLEQAGGRVQSSKAFGCRITPRRG